MDLYPDSSMKFEEGIGTWRGNTINKEGKEMKVVIRAFSYVPELYRKLFSVTNALNKGWSLNGNRAGLHLRIEGMTFDFDRRI